MSIFLDRIYFCFDYFSWNLYMDILSLKKKAQQKEEFLFAPQVIHRDDNFISFL